MNRDYSMNCLRHTFGHTMTKVLRRNLIVKGAVPREQNVQISLEDIEKIYAEFKASGDAYLY